MEIIGQKIIHTVFGKGVIELLDLDDSRNLKILISFDVGKKLLGLKQIIERNQINGADEVIDYLSLLVQNAAPVKKINHYSEWEDVAEYSKNLLTSDKIDFKEIAFIFNILLKSITIKNSYKNINSIVSILLDKCSIEQIILCLQRVQGTDVRILDIIDNLQKIAIIKKQISAGNVNDTRLLGEIFQLFKRIKAFKQCQNILDKLIMKNPKNPVYRVQRAKNYRQLANSSIMELGDFNILKLRKSGLSDYEISIELSGQNNEKNFYSYNGMAGIYTDMHQKDKAIECYNKVIGNDKYKQGFDGAFRGLGAICYKQKDYELGNSYFAQVSEKSLLEGKANEFLDEGDYESAIKILQLLIEHCPLEKNRLEKKINSYSAMV